MFGRFRHKRFIGGLAVGLLVLCALFTAGARAQSAPPPKPSGSKPAASPSSPSRFTSAAVKAKSRTASA